MNPLYPPIIDAAETIYEDLIAVERDSGGTLNWETNISQVLAEVFSATPMSYGSMKFLGHMFEHSMKLGICPRNRPEVVLYIASCICALENGQEWTRR